MTKNSTYFKRHDERLKKTQRVEKLEKQQNDETADEKTKSRMTKQANELSKARPNGGQAGKLNKQFIKINDKKAKLGQKQNVRDKKNQAKSDKYLWFLSRKIMKPVDNSCLAGFVKEYLEELSAGHTGDRKNVKQDLFAIALKAEVDKFNGMGLEVPDLLTKNGINSLLDWDQSDEKLQNVKVVQVKASWIKVEKVERVEKVETVHKIDKTENTVENKSDESEK